MSDPACRRLIHTTTSALRLLVVILCYPGAFAPSAPVPDPTSAVSGVFELEVQEPRCIVVVVGGRLAEKEAPHRSRSARKAS